jgi:hypothetical protein
MSSLVTIDRGDRSTRYDEIIWRDPGWFPRSLAGQVVAGTAFPSTGGLSKTARTVELGYVRYKIPDRPGKILGIKSISNNYVTTAVFFPRIMYDFLVPHPTYLGPYTRLDTSWTPELLGAVTTVTATTNLTTVQLASTTGMAIGDRIKFINPTGPAQVIGTIQNVDSSTQITCTGACNVTNGWVACKIWPYTDDQNGASSNNTDMTWMFSQAVRVTTRPTNRWIYIAQMVEHASTGAPNQEVALNIGSLPMDYTRFAYNANALKGQNDPSDL